MPITPQSAHEDDFTRLDYAAGMQNNKPQQLSVGYLSGTKWDPNSLQIAWSSRLPPDERQVQELTRATLEAMGINVRHAGVVKTGNTLTFSTANGQFTIKSKLIDGMAYITIEDSKVAPFPDSITQADSRVATLDALAQNIGQHVPNQSISQAFTDANVKLHPVYSDTSLRKAVEISRQEPSSQPRIIIGEDASGRTVVKVDIGDASQSSLSAQMERAQIALGHLQNSLGGTTNIDKIQEFIATNSNSIVPAQDVQARHGNPAIVLPEGATPQQVVYALAKSGTVQIGDMPHTYDPVITVEGARHASGQLGLHFSAESPAVRPRTTANLDAPRGGGAIMAVVSGVVVAGSVLYTGGNAAEAAEAAVESAASAIPGAGGAIARSKGMNNEADVRDKVDMLTSIVTTVGALGGGALGGLGGTVVPVAGNAAGAVAGAGAGGAIANFGGGLLADEMVRFGARYIDGQKDVAPALGEQLVVAAHAAAVEKATEGIEAAFAKARDIGDALSERCSYDGCAVDIAVQTSGTTTRSPYSITK